MEKQARIDRDAAKAREKVAAERARKEQEAMKDKWA